MKPNFSNLIYFYIIIYKKKNRTSLYTTCLTQAYGIEDTGNSAKKQILVIKYFFKYHMKDNQIM